jgi:hypothetical protein
VIRKFALLIIAAWGIWIAAVDDGVAQPAGPDLRSRCAQWRRLSLDKPGTRRYVYAFLVDRATPLRGEIMEDQPISGTFNAQGTFTIAVWSEPDMEGSTLQFTTSVGTQMEFVSDDGKIKRMVTEGILSDWPSQFQPPIILCPPGGRPGVASAPRPPVVVKRYVEETEEKTIDELKKKYGIGSEPSETGKRAKSFNELAQEVTRPPEAVPAEPPSGKPSEPPAAKPVPGEPPSPKPPMVIRRDLPSASQVVCKFDTFQPVPMLEEATDRQMVGWRNLKKEAEAFDYLTIGDAVGIDAIADLTASVNKVVPYEAVGRLVPNEALGRKSPGVWVSMKHGGLRWKPGEHKSAPSLPVRVVVAGGAAEIALSGLDSVGVELSKQSGGRAAVAVEWYPVTDNGSLGPAQRYDSIEDFVRAADEAKRDGRPIPLGEDEIRALLDSLQSILVEQTQPVDRVFWIKGAYMVPSAIPARFEQFIEAVTRNSAPVRASGEWLTVVTARMPGFSIGYLKAPVTSKNVGDVIEEPTPELKPRRFISDPKVLAARLWARANARAAAAPASEPAGPAASGKLVFDAKDIFVRRGYVVSPEALARLRSHLGTIETMWNGGAPSPAALADLAKKTGRASGTLIDLLQHAGGTPLLPLPKELPDWSRKALDKLDEGERGQAAELIRKYREGVGTVEDKWQRQRETRDPGCSFVYVPDKQFGLQ